MDKREVQAVRALKNYLARRQPSAEMLSRLEPETLNIGFESGVFKLPTIPIAPHDPRIDPPRRPICLTGWEGYRIEVSGRKMRSFTHVAGDPWPFHFGSEELFISSVTEGLISSEDEKLLRNIVERWTTDGELASWQPSSEYCGYHIHVSSKSDPSAPAPWYIFYDWEDGAAEVPKSVADLDAALRTMIKRMPPNQQQ